MQCKLVSALLLAGVVGGLAGCGSSGASNSDARREVTAAPGVRLVSRIRDAAARAKRGAPSSWFGRGDDGGAGGTGGDGSGAGGAGGTGGSPATGGSGGEVGAGGTDDGTGAGGTGGGPGTGGDPGTGGSPDGGGAGGDPGAGGTGGSPAGGGSGGEVGAGGAGGDTGAGGTGGGYVAERYVAPGGNDANPGTADRPWKTLAHAAATLLPGEAAYVAAGTYAPFRMDARDGTPDHPIALLAAPGARPLIRGGTVEFRRAHWVLQGFDISPAGSSFAVRFTGAGSKFNLLRDNLVHDGSAGAGISVDLGASDATIEGNEIWNFSRGGDIDSHGVVVQPTTARVRVLRNHIHDNNGDSVQCIGPEQVSTGGAPAADVLIEGNYMHEDRENAVDIKTCTDVTIRGNRAHSYFKTSTANGEGIVIHNGATRVIVEGNDVSNANRGVVIGEQISDVLVRHNVFHDGNNERIGIYFYQGKTMQAYHNTLINLATGVKVGTATGVTVANNVFSGCGQSVTGSGTVDRNLFFQSPTAGTGAITGDPRLDAAFVPADGSPALDAAKPLPGEPAGCGAAPDLGAKERC